MTGTKNQNEIKPTTPLYNVRAHWTAYGKQRSRIIARGVKMPSSEKLDIYRKRFRRDHHVDSNTELQIMVER